MKFLKIHEISRVDWGNTNLTKKAYVESGKYLGFSAAGPDGRLNHFEHQKNKPTMSAIGANCGKMYFIEEKFTAIKNTIVFNPNENLVIPKYLYYFCDFYSFPKRGAGQPFIAKTDIDNTELPVPSLQEQKIIVEKLDKVYENIENKVEKENYKINLYEKLYKSKLNQIFSNEFKKSGETELAKFSEIISGQSPKGEFINNSEGLEFHQGKKAFSGKFLLDSGKRTKHTTKQVPKNTIVMSVRAPVGPVNITQNNICIGRGLAGIIPKNANLDFMFYYLDFIKEENTGHVGATINSINRNEIMKIKIPNLNIEKQEKISNKIKEILELKNELASNSNKTLVMLNQLKQSMLRKEFSNE